MDLNFELAHLLWAVLLFVFSRAITATARPRPGGSDGAGIDTTESKGTHGGKPPSIQDRFLVFLPYYITEQEGEVPAVSSRESSINLGLG